VFSIILAAGKGTRMGAADLPKVCFDLGGVPVIVHAIETYKRCGVEHHIVVIGDRAEQVAAAVCERFPQTIFAYQPHQRGTGDAARCGAAVLDAFDYEGDVLVVAGDKVVHEKTLAEQTELFQRVGADLCFMVGAKENFPSSGRIVEDEAGHILSNIEVSDLARARLIERWLQLAPEDPLESNRLRSEMLESFRTERKAQRAMPQLWNILAERATITASELNACFSSHETYFEFTGPQGRTYRWTAQEIENRARWANLSVYCFRAEALRYALARLQTKNAQSEECLTDAIATLASATNPNGQARFRVVLYPIARPTDAMAFNTLEELEAIRAHYPNAAK